MRTECKTHCLYIFMINKKRCYLIALINQFIILMSTSGPVSCNKRKSGTQQSLPLNVTPPATCGRVCYDFPRYAGRPRSSTDEILYLKFDFSCSLFVLAYSATALFESRPDIIIGPPSTSCSPTSLFL
jgi:hypothetical protein